MTICGKALTLHSPMTTPLTPTAGAVPDTFVHLSAAGVSLVIDVTEQRLPAIVHWGSALGPQTVDDVEALALAAVEPASGNVVDAAVRVGVLPEHHAGW